MKFCDGCSNFLYITIDEDKNLVYYCKNCNNREVHQKANGSVLVIEDTKIDDSTRYSQYLNPNIKYDPTLPHVNNIKCPNTKCTKKENEESDTVYLKYDFVNMKYLYSCVHCDHFWKNT